MPRIIFWRIVIPFCLYFSCSWKNWQQKLKLRLRLKFFLNFSHKMISSRQYWQHNGRITAWITFTETNFLLHVQYHQLDVSLMTPTEPLFFWNRLIKNVPRIFDLCVIFSIIAKYFFYFWINPFLSKFFCSKTKVSCANTG